MAPLSIPRCNIAISGRIRQNVPKSFLGGNRRMTVDVGGARAATRADISRWPLVGRAGVGKTSLAMVGVELARDQGMAVALVAGSEAAHPYPFGAFASLLPVD